MANLLIEWPTFYSYLRAAQDALGRAIDNVPFEDRDDTELSYIGGQIARALAKLKLASEFLTIAQRVRVLCQQKGIVELPADSARVLGIPPAPAAPTADQGAADSPGQPPLGQ